MISNKRFQATTLLRSAAPDPPRFRPAQTQFVRARKIHLVSGMRIDL
jgi:hypothetical protein